MDPAHAEAVRDAIRHQGNLLGQHAQSLQTLAEAHQTSQDQLSQLNSLVISISTQLSQLIPVAHPALPPPSPASVVVEAHEVQMPTPEAYAGDTEKCRGFMMQCLNVFTHRPMSFASSGVRISYVVGLLRGRALEWAEARLCGGMTAPSSYSEFMSEFKAVFDHPSRLSEAANRLNELRQGRRSVADYAIDFRTLAVESGWNEAALRSRFVFGLSELIRDELIYRDEPDSLEQLIALCIRLSNRLRERRAGRDSNSQHAPRQSVPHPFTPLLPPGSEARREEFPSGFPSPPRSEARRGEPMQLGRARLTLPERSRRIREGECLYCGHLGHFRSDCPVRPKENAHQ